MSSPDRSDPLTHHVWDRTELELSVLSDDADVHAPDCGSRLTRRLPVRFAVLPAAAILSSVLLGIVPSSAAASPPQVAGRPMISVRQVEALTANGHPAHSIAPGTRVRLRIRWTVRNANSRARQIVTWTVFYARKQIVRVVKTSAARNGSWARTTTVTVDRNPNAGPHTFWGRVSVDGVSAARSTTFTIHR